MKCDSVRIKLLEVADGSTLPPALADHLESCPACREHLEMLRRHRLLLERVPSPQAPDALWSRIESRIAEPATIELRPVWWVAAAAVVLFAVGLAFVFYPRSPVHEGLGQGRVVATAAQVPSLDFLLARHATLQNVGILNSALVDETEQPGYVMLAGGAP